MAGNPQALRGRPSDATMAPWPASFCDFQAQRAPCWETGRPLAPDSGPRYGGLGGASAPQRPSFHCSPRREQQDRMLSSDRVLPKSGNQPNQAALGSSLQAQIGRRGLTGGPGHPRQGASLASSCPVLPDPTRKARRVCPALCHSSIPLSITCPALSVCNL